MSLYGALSGKPGAQPLVLLHGWGMTSGIWQSWLPALEAEFQVLIIDLPGLGSSFFEGDKPYTLTALAEQILAYSQPLLQQQPAIWLGWSLGGIVAAQIADQYPEQAAGLVTIATNPCFVERPDWPEAMAPETFEAFQDALGTHTLKTLKRFAMLQGQGDPDPRQLLRSLKAVTAESLSSASRLEESLALLATDYRPLFAGLSLPRLFLYGTEDALVPAAVAHSTLLSAHSRLIANAGHLPFITAEHAVTDAVIQATRHWQGS
ncbi:MAG: pimeloyl-[acyl-carrier protein] methyl ester esterase [Motiliproteus sp.]|jgi:pimeloyl-[acyl-carrier protein] methyl ester esterase